MSFKCHHVICLLSSGVFLLRRLLHHQNRMDVLSNDNGIRSGLFFSHQKVAFVGVPLHASNLPAMESWAPIPLTSTCNLEMTAQTVGEAVLYQLLETQHQILQSFLVQEKACSRHPVETNVVFKCMARRIVSQPDNPNSDNLLQLNGHLSNAHSCESHHRAQE
jgi:hypothetical protein